MNEKVKIVTSDPASLADGIAALLDSKKARDVVVIDLNGKTIIADYFVIASANSTTAVRSLADYVDEELGARGLDPMHRDADPKWVALDYGSVIVHIFYKELREFYNIERLWTDGDNLKKFERTKEETNV